MSVYMTFSDAVLQKIDDHFIRCAILAQAAFVKSFVSRDKANTYIHGYEFIKISDDNCEYITSDRLEIKAFFVLSLLKKIKWPKEGLIYIRTASSESSGLSFDDRMFLRMAYAFHPNSTHAVVYVKEKTMESFCLKSDITLEPLSVILK